MRKTSRNTFHEQWNTKALGFDEGKCAATAYQRDTHDEPRKIELILFVYTVSDAMLISTSKIVGKTVVVRVRRCVVGDFFLC